MAASRFDEAIMVYERDLKFSGVFAAGAAPSDLQPVKSQSDNSTNTLAEDSLSRCAIISSEEVEIPNRRTRAGVSQLEKYNLCMNEANGCTVVKQALQKGAKLVGIARTTAMGIGSKGYEVTSSAGMRSVPSPINPFPGAGPARSAHAGSAAAVAARCADIAIVTDVAGEAAIAAADVGVVALRPTLESVLHSNGHSTTNTETKQDMRSWPSDGYVTIAPSLQATAILARTANEIQSFLRSVQNGTTGSSVDSSSTSLSGLSIGIANLPYSGGTTAVAQPSHESIPAKSSVESFCTRLASTGAHMVNIVISPDILDEAMDLIRVISTYESPLALGHYVASRTASAPLKNSKAVNADSADADEENSNGEEEEAELKPSAAVKYPVPLDTVLPLSTLVASLPEDSIVKHICTTQLQPVNISSTAANADVNTSHVTHTQYIEAIAVRRPRLQHRVAATLREHGVSALLLPAVDSTENDEVATNHYPPVFSKHASLASALGWPALTIPCGLTTANSTGNASSTITPTTTTSVHENGESAHRSFSSAADTVAKSQHASTPSNQLPVSVQLLGLPFEELELLKIGREMQALQVALPDPSALQRWMEGVTLATPIQTTSTSSKIVEEHPSSLR